MAAVSPEPAARRANAASGAPTPAPASIDIPDPEPLYLDLWGVIALRVHLSALDANDASIDHVCHIMSPRQGFLFFSLPTLKHYFSPLVKSEQFIWFSSQVLSPSGAMELVPLPAHYPTGVLVDLLRSRDDSSFHRQRPINITIHFSLSLPPGTDEKVLDVVQRLRADSREQAGYDLYRERLKEALAVRYGNTQALAEVKHKYPEHYQRIVAGLRNNDAHAFYVGRSALFFCGDFNNNKRETYYGVAFHVGTSKVALRRVAMSKSTLAVVLQQCMPSLFGHWTRDDCVAAVLATGVVVQGICPLRNTPMDFLAEWFMSVDLVLHIVVTPELVQREAALMHQRMGGGEDAQARAER